MFGRNNDPTAFVIERYRSNYLLVLVVLAQLFLQGSRNIIPPKTVVAVKDQPAAALRKLDIIDELPLVVQLLQGFQKTVGHSGSRIGIFPVQRKVAARQRDGHIAATAPLPNLLFNICPAVLRG